MNGWVGVACVALLVSGCAAAGMSKRPTAEDISRLAARTEEANQALVRGDIDRYIELTDHASDYTLMAPFGGVPRHGFDASPANRSAMARFFKSGTLHQELIASYASGDLIVLVTIERAHGEVGGLSEQDWALRVTQVFRREKTSWQLVHRHADPLANGITIERGAELARGAR